MKVARKDLFSYLSRSPFRQTQFDVSILAQLHNLLMEPTPTPQSIPLQQEDNLRSKKHADVKLVVTGDMKRKL